MPTYLDRYLAGEYEQVWDELLTLGAMVREEPLYADALAVARETMRRARFNVERIVARLKQDGYQFTYPHAIFEPANPEQVSLLIELEREVGVLPMSVRACFEVIGSVILVGNHPSWWYSNPPRISYFRGAMELELMPASYGEEYKGRKIGIHIKCDDDLSYGSTCGSSEIIAPDPAIDGLFRSPERNIAPTFVGYLRKNFDWGGFPGFANVDEELCPTAWLAELTEGLLPI